MCTTCQLITGENNPPQFMLFALSFKKGKITRMQEIYSQNGENSNQMGSMVPSGRLAVTIRPAQQLGCDKRDNCFAAAIVAAEGHA